MRNSEIPKPTTSWWAVILLVIGGGVFAWYIAFTGRGINLAYDEIEKLDKVTREASLQTIELGSNSPIYVTDLSQYSVNRPWMYVTESSPLPNDYEPASLAAITLPAGDKGTVMKLRGDVLQQLGKLFRAAENEGYDLMVSSAYRSIEDQKTLYNSIKRTNGEAYADKYALDPGASEHHTGYAVDLTDASTACEEDSDDCILSPATAAWLADYVSDYGFIIRYPSGKESITGIPHEPWHLRYVGVVLATQLYENDLTLDEFIEQVTPGRIR